MKFTHDRHFNIVEIDVDSMPKEDMEAYASYRPIWDSKEEAERQIINYKPCFVTTGTDGS